jgi:hypothetical protein
MKKENEFPIEYVLSSIGIYMMFAFACYGKESLDNNGSGFGLILSLALINAVIILGKIYLTIKSKYDQSN